MLHPALLPATPYTLSPALSAHEHLSHQTRPFRPVQAAHSSHVTPAPEESMFAPVIPRHAIVQPSPAPPPSCLAAIRPPSAGDLAHMPRPHRREHVTIIPYHMSRSYTHTVRVVTLKPPSASHVGSHGPLRTQAAPKLACAPSSVPAASTHRYHPSTHYSVPR